MLTKIKTTVYAARLRKKLDELRKARPKELENYKKAVAAWRDEFKAWLVQNLAKRVDNIKIERTDRYYGDRVHFDTSLFFVGAPTPPKYPDDRQIREIQALLRQLGITGQQTIQVSTEDVARLLGGPDEALEDRHR